jgi:hypothetical protein
MYTENMGLYNMLILSINMVIRIDDGLRTLFENALKENFICNDCLVHYDRTTKYVTLVTFNYSMCVCLIGIYVTPTQYRSYGDF